MTDYAAELTHYVEHFYDAGEGMKDCGDSLLIRRNKRCIADSSPVPPRRARTFFEDGDYALYGDLLGTRCARRRLKSRPAV